MNYPAAELGRIAGLKTEGIATVLGYCPYDEVVHRDNLAVIARADDMAEGGGATS